MVERKIESEQFCVSAAHLNAVFVTVGGASRAGALLFGEDYDVLIKENAPRARPLPPRSSAHRQLALPHQLAALRRVDLESTPTDTLGDAVLDLRPRTNLWQKMPSKFLSEL